MVQRKRQRLPAEINRVRAKLADGSVKYYFYLRGRKDARFWTDTHPNPTDPAFFAAYVEVQKLGLPKGKNLVPGMVDAYLSSAEFKAKSPRTKIDYRKWALRFAQEFKDDPVAMFEEPASRAEVSEWRQQWAHSAKQFDYAGTVVTLLLNWARDAGKIAEHHCGRLPNAYKADRAEVVWTTEDVKAFTTRAPDWAARILIAACETGLRPGDLIRLSRAHIEDTPAGRRIRIKTNKRGRVAHIPVLPLMAKVLDATPKDRLLILTNASGQPLTENRASVAVRQWRDKAGLSDTLRLQDARGTAATRLLNAGLSLAQIASFMGWGLRHAQNVIEHYARLSPDESDSIFEALTVAKRHIPRTDLQNDLQNTGTDDAQPSAK